MTRYQCRNKTAINRNPSLKPVVVHGDKQQSLSFIDPEIDPLKEILFNLKFDHLGNPYSMYETKVHERPKFEGRRYKGLLICGIVRLLHIWIAMQVKLIFPDIKDYEVHHWDNDPRNNTLPHWDENGEFQLGNLFLITKKLHSKIHMTEESTIRHEIEDMLGMPIRRGFYSKCEIRDWEYRLCGEMPPSVHEDDDYTEDDENSDQLYLFD